MGIDFLSKNVKSNFLQKLFVFMCGTWLLWISIAVFVDIVTIIVIVAVFGQVVNFL